MACRRSLVHISAAGEGRVFSLEERLHRWACGIARWLASQVTRDSGFPGRSFYGETFGIWLLSQYPDASSRQASEWLLDYYSRRDKNEPEFHWEFNNYALVNLHAGRGGERFARFAYPLRFKNTPATNWRLLRYATEMTAGEALERIAIESKCLLRQRQARSGLIYDAPGARSFQYHCFSATLIGEIFARSRDDELGRRFRDAADFITEFVLRNGDGLYIGRGQEQSFGYGSLIYLLALAAAHTGNPKYIEKLAAVLQYVSQFVRADGSFPLVLRTEENGFPKTSASNDPRFTGWYSYNNYFDYLPFFGVMLSKAAVTLAQCRLSDAPNISQSDYVNRNFWLARRPDYDAVVAAPGGTWKGWGHWSNDLPIPYVVSKGGRLTPSYGGEEYGLTLYSQEAIPLPVFRESSHFRSIRRGRTWSAIIGGVLILFSEHGILLRRYSFRRSVIHVADLILGQLPLYNWFLFDAPLLPHAQSGFVTRTGLVLTFSSQMEVQPEAYYAWSGELTAVRTSVPSRSMVMSLHLPRQ